MDSKYRPITVALHNNGSIAVANSGVKLAGLWHTVRQSPHILGIPLLFIIGWPVIISWISALIERPGTQNGVQFGAAMLIVIAIIRSFQKCRSQPLTQQPDYIGWLFLLVSCVGYLIADFFAVKSVLWVSYIGILGGYGWALLGRRNFYRWLPVLLFSGFLLPTVNAEIQMAISLPLQVASAQLATWLTSWLMPVSTTDTMITIGENSLQVTPACSGLQSWIGFFFAGLLWQMFEGSRPRMLLWLIPGALFLSWILNGIRLGITIVVTYYFSIEQAIAIHTNLDWFLFPAGLIILWQAGSRIKDTEPLINKTYPKYSFNTKVPTATLILMGILAASHLVLTETSSPILPNTTAHLQISHRIAGWNGTDLPLTPAEQKAFGSAKGINREYSQGEDNYLWLKILQSGSIADIHNFYGCLMVQGIQPKILDHLRIQTPSGILNATLMEFEYEGNWFYSVLWHQWGNHTSANRWDWYEAVMKERLQHRSHRWNIVKLTMPQTKENTTNSQLEREQLIHFATVIYQELSKQ